MDMNVNIELGKQEDIKELEQLYNDLNDYLAANTNYPGWKKGVYPIREDADTGIQEGNLYVAKSEGKIIGTIILSHKPDPAYLNVKWQIISDYTDIMVIHTFAVHPDYLRCGVGRLLIDFAVQLCTDLKLQAIRLDVYEKNIPAIRLYEECGFDYIDTVDLGLGEVGLDWFRLYERLI